MARNQGTPPPEPASYHREDGRDIATFDGNTIIELRNPHYDKYDRLFATVVGRVGDTIVNQADINLLNQRDRFEFAQLAHDRDGDHPWQSCLVSVIPYVEETVRQRTSPDQDPQAPEAPADPWPRLETAALYGIAGTLTMAIDQYTEADHVAVLLNILTAAGNAIGSGPYFTVEFTRHRLRIFAALVGETAKGRKGQSWSTPRHVFECIDQEWTQQRVTSGLSSGEGLIYAVRDQRKEQRPIKVKGRIVGYEEVIVDHGEADKRLLIVEEELAQALKVMAREGNILSPVIRQAWDTGNLHPLTKTNPIQSTDAHISIIGHITRDELLRHLDTTEQANGFANRFLWACVRRSKSIPDPTGMPAHLLNPLITKLQHAIVKAKGLGELRRDAEAQQLWCETYPDLSKETPGLLGAITARSESQVMRLACLYAALDETAIITCDHLRAALAVWRYSEASARYIFGDSTGDPIADRVLSGLQEGPMDRTAISGLFGRNVPAEWLERSIAMLLRARRIATTEIKGRGRPLTIYSVAEKP